MTTMVGGSLRESAFISTCADTLASAGRHVTVIPAGNPGLTICMNSYENLGADHRVSGAQTVAACILALGSRRTVSEHGPNHYSADDAKR
jgi:hypothetical protein